MITLPEKSIPLKKFSDYTFMIYGPRHVGKTTLFSEFEDPFFFMWEPGGKALAIKQMNVPTWEVGLDILQSLKAKKGYCKTVIFDTGYMAYERCFAYTCKKFGVIDPKDKSFGTVWKFIEKEFREFQYQILDLGVSFGVTAHSEVKEVKERNGTSYDKLQTQLSSQAQRLYKGMIDVTGYYNKLKDGSRVLTIQDDSFIEAAGNRAEGHFLYQNTNQPIANIPMGKNKKEAYQNLLKAFNNTLDDSNVAARSTAKVKRI